METEAPCWANNLAIALPIPEPPPVIMADLLSSENIIIAV
jgi:hypothetical protein